MSLEGTNSYLIGHPAASEVVVVDPGPPDARHLAELAGAGRIALILITHHHIDHTESAAEFHAMTGAPVRAIRSDFCHAGDPLSDGETIHCAGTEIQVLATPGHSADSVCFFLPSDGPHGSVLTGDTILGRGTTVIAYPDGRLGQYLDSLDRLMTLGPALVLPAHGPTLLDVSHVGRAYLEHRSARLAEVRSAVTHLREGGQPISIGAVADLVYGSVDPAVRPAAEKSVAAQLDYLDLRQP